MIHVGFTGTRHTVTREQSSALWQFLHGLPEFVAHHGDCVGADSLFHDMAHELDRDVVIHPPIDKALRAHRRAETTLQPLPYLDRNLAIVMLCDAMVACPEDAVEQRRGGTWSTIRIARNAGKPLAIVMPDGTVQKERWPDAF